MPRLTEKTRQDRRQQIADAAMRCFARQGFAATSMADIIAEAGLSAGSIYSHFESKADLMRFTSAAKLAGAFTTFLGDLGSPDGVIDPAMLIETALPVVASRRAEVGLLLQIWAECPRDPEIAAVAAENVARIRERFSATLLPWARTQAAAGAEAGAVSDSDAGALAATMADTFITCLQGFMVRLVIDPSADPQALAASIAAGFRLGGVGTGHREP